MITLSKAGSQNLHELTLLTADSGNMMPPGVLLAFANFSTTTLFNSGNNRLAPDMLCTAALPVDDTDAGRCKQPHEQIIYLIADLACVLEGTLSTGDVWIGFRLLAKQAAASDLN